MAVGNTADKAGLNAKLGDVAVSIRDSTDLAEELWGYIASLGADQAAQQAALVTAGFSSAEAADFWTKANYAYSVRQLYHGVINQPVANNYHDGLAAARGAS